MTKKYFKILVVLLAVLFASPTLFSTSSVLNHFGLAASAQTYETNGFALINSQWGTTTSTVQAGPGDQDVPLTMTLQYLYSYPSVSTEFEIALPNGITSTSSSRTGQDVSNATAYYVNKLDQGQIFQITLYLDLANDTSLGQYKLSSTIFWYAILSNSTSQPEVYLQQDLSLVVSLNGDSNLQYSTNDTALTPDKINDVSLTLTNSGSGNVTDITTTVSDSSPTASILNELPSDLNLGADSNLTEMLEVFVPQSAAGSILALNLATTYLDPYQNQQSTTQSLGFFVSSVASTSTLTFALNQTSLVPGGINNLTITLTNNGDSTLSNISTVISVPSITSAESALPDLSIVSSPATISSLAAGASVSLSLSVFVSASAAGTPVTLSVSSTYVNPTGLGESYSNSYGLYVSNLTTGSSPVITVSEIGDLVTTGVPSQVAILVNNTGLQPIFDPSFSLTTTSPLFVSANSTYTMTGARINPGAGVVLESTISSGPDATIGVYGGSLTVSYTNEYGVASSQTVNVSFTLLGKIDFVVQGEVIAQSSNDNLTISGTLLNEGTVSAYYATAVGYVQGSSPNNNLETYVGEVDVNTPVPFTVTVPYTAGSSSTTVNVTLAITYQDSFGRNSTYVSSAPATLLSAAQLSQQNSGNPTTTKTGAKVSGGLIFIVLILVIIILIVAIVAMRRSGNKSKKSKAVV